MTTQKQILKRILMIVLSAILFYGISEMTMVTALCAQTEDVEINEENFPDAGFREYLRTDPNMQELHSDPDKFTAAEIESITVLNMKNSSLTAESLAGIEHFENLTTLHCNGTYLKSIDVSKNTKLQYLNCSETWNLTTLNVKNCTELATLYCNRCKLTELDLSSNGQLQVLWCDNNQLTALDTAGNPQLKTLYCYNNQLAALELRSNLALKELRCYNNQLTTLDLSGNTALTSLSCENNQLTEIQLKGFSNLTSLSIQENLLTSLDVSDCPELSYLRCSDNQLTELNITGDNKLTSLICTNNRLAEIDVKDKSSLNYFDTRKNLLKTLDVSQNADLQYFYCDDNQLKEIDVSKNPALMTFWCKNNQLEMLDVSGNIKISNLDCTGNRLKSLIIPDSVTTFEACEQYDKITMAENQSSYDLGSADPKLDPSKISDLTNAQLSADGMILTDIQSGKDVTYTYDCGNHQSMKVTLHFIRANRWITELTAFPGWKYGDTPSTPYAEALFGEVQYLYGTASDSNSYSTEIPTEPGTWYVKAIVAETEEYSGLEGDPVEFVISKNEETRIDITEGIKDIPEALIAAGMDTEEKIKQALTRAAVESQGYSEDNTALYDVRLQISLDGGKTWETASPENFPPEGLSVTLPYPKGTNGTEYDFIITHMFTHEMNGYKPGEIEVPEVMKTEEGLRFTVRGLSPIAAAWKSVKTDDGDNQGGADKPPVNPGPANPSIPGNNDIPTQPGSRQPSGGSDGNTPVTSAANRRSPQTGDENGIRQWMFVMCLAGSGIILSKKIRKLV